MPKRHSDNSEAQLTSTQSLHDLQSEFTSAIRKADNPVPTSVAEQNGHVPQKRFAVYRNNVYVSLIEALQRQFPVIHRLVGEDFFRSLARVYVEDNLPTSPLMFQYGETFPIFLESFEKIEDLPYLADVARIEYARTQSYHAADATPLSIQDLAAVPQDQFPLATLTLHPSMHLIASPYPVYTIWEANMKGGDMPEISLDQGAEDVMVIRPELTIYCHCLAPGSLTFLENLSNGEQLGAAVETAMETTSEFNFATALQTLANAGAFTNVSITPSN